MGLTANWRKFAAKSFAGYLFSPRKGHSRGADSFCHQCHMSVTPRREVLLKMLANFDQQMADAAALMGALKEGSPDYDAASAWLAESTAESARVSKLLAETADG
jgi:hypothetical protein